MTRTGLIIWCVVIGTLSALYATLWANIPTVQNYMWIAFVSMPLYFCSGAEPKLFPQHAACAVSGVIWGVLTLALLDLGLIGNANLNLLVGLVIMISLCCIVHMVLFPANVMGGLLANAPMVFGGYSTLFSQGSGEALGVSATLLAGLAVGAMINIGGGIIGKTFSEQPVVGTSVDAELEAE